MVWAVEEQKAMGEALEGLMNDPVPVDNHDQLGRKIGEMLGVLMKTPRVHRPLFLKSLNDALTVCGSWKTLIDRKTLRRQKALALSILKDKAVGPEHKLEAQYTLGTLEIYPLEAVRARFSGMLLSEGAMGMYKERIQRVETILGKAGIVYVPSHLPQLDKPIRLLMAMRAAVKEAGRSAELS